MINICKTLGVSCLECPFRDRCNMSFEVYGTKEYWLEELNDMLHIIESAIKKVEEAEEE